MQEIKAAGGSLFPHNGSAAIAEGIDEIKTGTAMLYYSLFEAR